MQKIFVLCHTVLYDALGKDNKSHPEHRESAKKFLNHIIKEVGRIKVITANTVINSFSDKLTFSYGTTYEFISLIKSIIKTVDTDNFNNINESVIILADIVSSLPEKNDTNSIEVILVTNMPNKIKRILEFYRKSEKGRKKWEDPKEIPFKVQTTSELAKELKL